MIEQELHFDDATLVNQLFGVRNMHLTMLAVRSGTTLKTRGCSVLIQGNAAAVSLVSNLLSQLYGLLHKGYSFVPQDIEHAYGMLVKDPAMQLASFFSEACFPISPKKTLTPKTLGQRKYVMALQNAPITFAVGPAGTGKTYLAVAMAVSMLLSRKVKRLILTRPAVEAGERLGFLPGDLAEKINPYLRPLYDALYDMLDYEQVATMFSSGTIEIAPLAFMRGRTLSNAYIILDEAQNATPEQMKMFLTRMGFGSHMVVTGDITQIDLPHTARSNALSHSGLIVALSLLQNIEGIEFVQFHKEDVVRHPLVGRIVEAYEQEQR